MANDSRGATPGGPCFRIESDQPVNVVGCSCGWPKLACARKQLPIDDDVDDVADEGDTGEDTNVEDSYAR